METNADITRPSPANGLKESVFTKVTPYTESDEVTETVVARTFRHVKLGLRIAGFYIDQDVSVESPSPRLCQLGLFVYCVFCNLVAVFNVARFFYMYITKQTFTITSFAYFAFVIEVACISVLESLAMSKNYNTFVRLLDMRRENHRKKYSSRFTIVVNTSMAITMIMSLAITIASPIFKVSNIQQMPPFNSMTEHVGKFFYVMEIIFGSMRFYISVFLFNVMSYCTYVEFAEFSNKFRKLYRENNDTFETQVGDIWNEHLSICSLLAPANAVLKHYVAFTYIAGMPIFCFMIFGLIRGELPREELTFLAFIFVFCVSLIANTTAAGVLINQKAHEPVQHIYSEKFPSYTRRTMQKISLFITRLQHLGIGYSVYGLFTVDKSAIHMVCGTLLTYAVVVLQLQPDSPSTCITTCSTFCNSTPVVYP